MFVVSILWVAFFIINFNVAMMIPLLPFIQAEIGLTTGQAALVLAAFPVVALVSNLAIGPFIDRFGRKRFIVVGAACCAAILALTAAAGSIAPIVAGRAATGIFMPMIGASVFAAIADYLPEDRRGRAAGVVTTAAPVAFLCAMSLGVVLGGLLAWQAPILMLAAICAGLALAAATLAPARPEMLASGRITARTYADRALSLSLDGGTRLLLPAFFCWAAAVYVFLGLYPSWAVQRGLAGHGAGAIGGMLFVGEVGGLLGALFSGWLSRRFGHPLLPCAVAAGVAAVVVALVPLGSGMWGAQAAAYVVFAFARDLMLALMLGGSMLLVRAAERGSLNAALNALYQTGASLGGMASAWLYAARPDFAANALAACALFAVSGVLLWRTTRAASPEGQPS